MTREERAREVREQYSGSIHGFDEQAQIAAMLAFADAEAAAMRERAAGHMRKRAEELREKSTNLSTGAMMYAIYMEEADKIAALPATGEVGRG